MSEHNPMSGDGHNAQEALDNVINVLAYISTTLAVKTKPNTDDEDYQISFQAGEIKGLQSIIACCKGACENAFSYHNRAVNRMEKAKTAQDE